MYASDMKKNVHSKECGINVLPTVGSNRTSITLSDVSSDIIIKSRIKYGNGRATAQGLLMEYSKCSTIHGIRYIFEAHRPIYEKLFWLIILTLSLTFAILQLRDVYLKWMNSPVILNFDESLIPIYKIPFPTVTICPETKTNTEFFHFKNTSQQIWNEIVEYKKFENLSNLTQEEISQFASLLHLCEPDVIKRFAPYLPNESQPDVGNILNTIQDDSHISVINWNHVTPGELIYPSVATAEGICYQFNGLHTKDIYRDIRYLNYYNETKLDFTEYMHNLPYLNNITGNWTLEDGYVNQGFNTYPQRTIFASANNGLEVFMVASKENIDYSCRRSTQGYKVFLHSPETAPLTSGNYFLMPHGYELVVHISPHFITSSENLHTFKPETRHCYFNDERYLRYFRYYSQNNCQIECLTNYTISKCGCVKFWMPKPLEVPLCGVSHIDCYTHADEELKLILQKEHLQQASSIQSNVERMCDCIPACTSLEYDVEISRTTYNFDKSTRALRADQLFVNIMSASMKMHFKDDQFTAIKRTVHYGLTTLIANFGGIFALFMGISGLSIIEILYFISLRLINTLRQRRNARRRFQKSKFSAT